MAYLRIANLKKSYRVSRTETQQVLRGINAEFKRGEFVAIVGESGSGKSTFMNILGGLDNDYTGSIVLNGEVLGVDISMIFKLTEEQAKEQTREVIALNKTDGYYNDYKLTKISAESGDMYIFLDCSKDLYFARNFLKISVTIGVAAVILIFGLIWLFSSIAVKPIAESYSK